MNNKIDEFFEKDSGKSKVQRWTDADNSRLNVVYIHTHDTGRMIGPYDDRFDTPALNRLAADGTVLDHLYCVGPTCSPSRSGLLTGRMPHQNGMLGLAHRGFSIYDMDQHFCRFIGRQGYETALCGMQHEVHDPDLIGYDHLSICSRPEAEDLTAWDSENADAACSFIRNEHTDPFFLSYGLVHTHRPFLELDEDIVVDDNDVPACLPITAMVKQDMARFMTSVRRADECIGRVLDALEEQKLLDHTIVFYTTDHGPAFPFMKCTLTEGGTGVSGIIHIPGNVRAGQHIETMLSHLDFYPTLCDLLQIPKPDWLEGKSFASLLLSSSEKDSVAAVNQAVFSEINYHAAYEPQRSVRNQRYRLIVRYDDQVAGFSAGKYAMIHQGVWAQQVIDQNEVAFDNGFIPYPTGGNDKLAVGTATGWRVNNAASEEQQKAAKTFLDWLITSEDGQKHSADLLNFIPAYTGVKAPAGNLTESVAEYAGSGKIVGWVYNTDFPSGMDVDGATSMQKYYADQIDSTELLQELSDAWVKNYK